MDFGPRTAAVTTSKTVTTVFDRILEAIHEGRLQPGQHISDGRIAEQFGVSRTPVREAIQRLREIGIVEASRGRFTRIAEVTPEQTSQAFQVWLALYAVLIDEVVAHASPRILHAMTGDRERFIAALDAPDAQQLAMANLDFFSRLPPASNNAALQRAIISVVHIVRLGSMHLPEYVDLAKLSESQSMMLDAVRSRNVDLARDALAILRRIEIPRNVAPTP